MNIVRKKLMFRVLLLPILTLWVQVAASQQPGPVHDGVATPVQFSISAQPMDRALKEFARQARLQLIFATADIAPHTLAPAVTGIYLPEAALAKLLEKSSLSYKFVNVNTVSIEVSDLRRH